ncbi:MULTISPECIES: hypothetical protein [Bacillaceae]|uniref:hypothetical protein n=1 Tax=Bacillaceae TaxID=186817 RepID=UPI0012BAA8ED|nr:MULTISPECIES: hypothetical protein [Bacillaceae]MCR4353424.1 hypothetical protein [Bacillus pumilus]MCY7505141.1 hypothetical protein [Bacillus pumilus]MED4725716.1 hypothetical protein [Bacillus pumilus]MED4745366.1 hypothetical protein [Bacillus pumilus]
MAHFWHYLGKAFCLRAVMMVLGDKLKSGFHCGTAFLLASEWSINIYGEMVDCVDN